MRTSLSKIASFVLAIFFLILPLRIFAAEQTCDCYCGSSVGAVDQNQKVTSTRCQNICSGQGLTVAAFACGANQYPERKVTCFTKTQCDGQSGEFGSVQPPECVSGSHYCYPNAINNIQTKLQVQIGGMKVVGDIGKYMEVAYKWLVGVATLIAIVFIMVGGFQWAFGAVSASQIKSAQKRMMNGIIGLVLLLSAYLILYTVNPQLVKLEPPKLPMIRTIGISDISSCEWMYANGYTIDNVRESDGLKITTEGECGDTVRVLKDPSGKDLPDGTVCNYVSCDSDVEVCVPGDKPQCMRCEELGASNSVVAPTPELCSMFNSQYVSNGMSKMEQKDGETVVKTMNFCFFSRDPDVGGEPLGRGGCARVEVDCSSVTFCGQYDKIPVYHFNGISELDNVDIGKNSGLSGTQSGYGMMLYNNAGDLTLGSFCQGPGVFHDICEWNRWDRDRSCYIDSTELVPISNVIITTISPGSYDCEATPRDWSGASRDISR